MDTFAFEIRGGDSYCRISNYSVLLVAAFAMAFANCDRLNFRVGFWSLFSACVFGGSQVGDSWEIRNRTCRRISWYLLMVLRRHDVVHLRNSFSS